MQKLVGLKIRALRKQQRLTQAQLAKHVGISPSYLNLIELNKRTVTGALLDRICAQLGADPGTLDGGKERRIIGNLEEICADPAIADTVANPGAAEDLVGRYPAWADLILRLYQTYQDERQAVLALADRLNRDPFLGESVHRILTNITSIRSAAEILQSGEALNDADRKRFVGMIGTDIKKLSGTARALEAFFVNANMPVRSATPMEHVDAFLLEADNYFPALEEIAADFLRSCAGRSAEAAAMDILGDEAQTAGPARLEPAERRRFGLMLRLAHRIAGDAIQQHLAPIPAFENEEAQSLAISALMSYTAAAILMPYEPFLAAAEQHRYDIDSLSRLFDVSYEQAAHRLATLRRAGAEGVRFAFMRSDPSGFITKRLPLPRLPLPRYSSACPLWVIYNAFQTPGMTVGRYGELPSGDRFLFFARAVEKRPASAMAPRHLLSVMLACPEIDAEKIVYGDGMDRASAMAPVGTVCRLCPRQHCGHRQEAALIG